MTQIHPTAIVSDKAEIHETAIIGPYCIVGDNVSIGAGTKLLRHVVVSKNTRIGKNNEIFQFASIGEDCQDLKYNGEETWLEIGDNNSIRESCTFHRGTIQDNSLTKIGSNNLFMVNTHIAHDCIVGDGNVLANNVGVAGHVHIGNGVILGGNAGVHQFCRIDDYSMVGGGSVILKDVVALTLVSGNPAKPHGLNIEGMRRKQWAKDTILTLRDAYKLIFKSGKNTVDVIEELTADFLPKEPKVALLIDSLKNSNRGITR